MESENYVKIISLSILILFCINMAWASDDIDENITIKEDDLSELNTIEEIERSEEAKTVNLGVEITEKVSANDKTFKDLQELVDSAENNDTIQINGTYKSASNLNINKSLTFKGVDSAILDGANNKYHVVIANDSNLTFENINFKNFNGILAIEYEKIYVFQDEDIDVDYERVYDSYITTVIFKNCNITNNNDLFGINTEGDIEYATKLKLLDCNIVNNTYFYIESILEIKNSKFKNNKMHIRSSAFTCHNSIFSDNYNSFYSSLLSCSKGSIINATFSNNSNDGLYMDNMEVSNTNVSNSGHISISSGYKTYFTNCSFNNNKEEYGGAIHSKGTVYLTNCIFNSNKAEYGGAIYSEGTTYLNNCEFKNNENPAIFAKKIIINSKQTFENAILDNSFKKIDNPFKIEILSKTRTFSVARSLQIKITYKNKPFKNYIPLTLTNTKTNKKITWDWTTTNSKGIANYKFTCLCKSPPKFGTFKVEIYYENIIGFPEKTITVKFVKASTITKAPKVVSKYKKSKFFKVTVKYKSTKKPVKKIRVKIKVYTGKKSKTYKIVTNSKGVVKLNTKNLKKGLHKVVVSTTNKLYSINAKSSIRIK